MTTGFLFSDGELQKRTGHGGLFLRGLLENPRGVSAPAPSGRILAAKIAAQIDPAVPGLIVELGPGTGAVTAALLARGIAPDRILAIEQNEVFAGFFRCRFPTVTLSHGDGFAFEDHLPAGAQVAAVVSGLPLLNFPAGMRQSLLRRALETQGPSATFVQLSYGWGPPVKAEIAGAALTRTAVWRNFPPAYVWTYRRTEAVSP
ncbi:MAG TPA: hypothetical protein VHV26_18065 [Rhizomicrobium sp.]|nr:hypothetical protein [Rhizomicrobium sp.]